MDVHPKLSKEIREIEDVRILHPKLSEKIYILLHGRRKSGCGDPPSQTIKVGERS